MRKGSRGERSFLMKPESVPNYGRLAAYSLRRRLDCNCIRHLGLRLRNYSGILIAICCACNNGPRPHPRQAVPNASLARGLGEYTKLHTIDVPELPIRKIRSISLGSSSNNTPGSLDDVAITRDGIDVLDNAASLVRGYDRDGIQRFTLPTRRSAAGQLHAPIRLDVMGDTLLVVDIDEARGVTFVAPSGQITKQIPLRVGSATVDVAPLPSGRFAVAKIAQTADITNGIATIVAIVSADGRELATGCASDPLYRESILRNGEFRFFRGAGVSVYNGRIYCRQAATPVVQVLSQDGKLATTFRSAPPFYERGEDHPLSMNSTVMDQFRSTWWEHVQFYPTARGFISVYTTFDPRIRAGVYRLFVCDSVNTRMTCHVSVVPGTPLTFLQPDTLIVSEPLRNAGDIRMLGFYTVAP